ncbi:trichohyalin-like isoform X2 [Amphibalanus amphitrite]|uniref:trichohyalin-like isoform X2 n=1 Tax=Amphibalanus amphitrite TaxID=1232801 RepID=UPI001C8FAB37|nr:trichohyalin-like isoform X2 [Amphibalanus amphitrite]
MPHDAVYLNLYNFDLPQHEDSPYIITSPRSLKACHKLGIKPCELLYKSLDEYEQELPHLPLRDVVYQYERHERARQGLDRSGEYFTDIPGDDGDLSSEDEVREDVWSNEDDGEAREDGGRTPSPARGEDSVAENEDRHAQDEDRRSEDENATDKWVRGEGDRDGGLAEEGAYSHRRDAVGESNPSSDEDGAEGGEESEDEAGREDYESSRYREESPLAPRGVGGHSDSDSDSGAAAEDGDGEPDWYPMEDSRAADIRLELRSSPGLSAPSGGRQRRSRPVSVTFSGRPPEAAPSARKAAPRSRATSASSRSKASRCSTPHLKAEGRRHDTATMSGAENSDSELRVRPSDRRILELMSRRQEQERLQERHAVEEHQRWRQECLQELRRQSERQERREEAVLARRRAEAWESRRRREELQQQHSQSLENLTALIRGREERAALELAAQRGRKDEQLAERRRREQQQQLLTAQQREQLESEERERRREQQRRLQRRMDETERRRNDIETARTQHVSSLNASWLALSEERIQRLGDAAERRSQKVWEELSRRIQSAAENQRRLERGRRAHAAVKSATESERRRQAREARQRQLQLSAGRGREAAARLQRDQQRAERVARQLAESRRLAVSRENLTRQSRHQQALRHIRQMEEQVLDEARFKLRLDEARVEQFVQQRDMAVMSSRHLAHVAANLRQAVRSGDRSATFDRMAARADLESRVLYGPAHAGCDRLYRPRSQTHIL